jgi:hypothetical protein
LWSIESFAYDRLFAGHNEDLRFADPYTRHYAGRCDIRPTVSQERVLGEAEGEELYDYEEDPSETKNLASIDEAQPLKNKLRERLEAMTHARGRKIALGNANGKTSA